jgi:hypothetical protein
LGNLAAFLRAGRFFVIQTGVEADFLSAHRGLESVRMLFDTSTYSKKTAK